MSAVSNVAHRPLPALLDCERPCTDVVSAASTNSPTMKSSGSVGGGAAIGRPAGRVTAANSSAVRGMTWRDVTPLSSSQHAQPWGVSPGGLERSPSGGHTRTFTMLPPPAASAAEREALARGVGGFQDFVRRLPTAAGPETASRDDLRLSRLDATRRPVLSRLTSTMTVSLSHSVLDNAEPQAASAARHSSPAREAPPPLRSAEAQSLPPMPASSTGTHIRPGRCSPSAAAPVSPTDAPALGRRGDGDERSADGDDSQSRQSILSAPVPCADGVAPPSARQHGPGGMFHRQRSSSVVAEGGETLFHRYLERTRDTVLSGQVSEAERASAIDALIDRSKELFRLLESMQTSLARTSPSLTMLSGASVPPCTMPSVLPCESLTEPPERASGTAPMTVSGTMRPPAAAAAASAMAALMSATDMESVRSVLIDPLSASARLHSQSLAATAGTNAAAARALGGFERGRRSSLSSCSNTSVAYMDIINNYCVMRLLGIGATGRAYLVYDRKTSTYYAMKTLPKHTHRTAKRHFALRPPPSSSECSLMDQVMPVAPQPEGDARVSPRGLGGNNSSSNDHHSTNSNPANNDSGSSSVRQHCFGRPGGDAAAGVAGGGGDGAPLPLALQIAASDTVAPTTITRAGWFATSRLRSSRRPSATSVDELELREADMDELGQTVSQPSGIVIPFVESVVDAESSMVYATENTQRERALQSVLADDALMPRPAGVRRSNSFARRTAEVMRSSSSSARLRATQAPMRVASSREKAPTAATAAAAAAAAADAPLSAVEREIRILRRLQSHPHVVHLREVVDDDEEDCAYLVMTYAANGPLTRVHGFDPESSSAACTVVRPLDRCARLLRELADALVYVHRQRIVHNDVKPDNILLTETDGVLLTDFGESVLIPKRLQSANGPHQRTPQADTLNATVAVPHNRWKPTRGVGDSFLCGDAIDASTSYRGTGVHPSMSHMNATFAGVSQTLMTEMSFRPDSSMFLAAGVDHDGRLNGERVVLGSPAFAAPELIDSSVCSYKSDAWSFGVVTYAIVFGRLPFAGPSVGDTFDDILHGPLSFPPLSDVPQHEDMTEATYDQWVALCSKLLVREPKDRISLTAALRHPLLRTAAPTHGANGPAGSSDRPSAASSSRRSGSAVTAAADAPSSRKRASPARSTAGPEAAEALLSPLARSIRMREPVEMHTPPHEPLSTEAALPSRSGTPPPGLREGRTPSRNSSPPTTTATATTVEEKVGTPLDLTATKAATGTSARSSPSAPSSVPTPLHHTGPISLHRFSEGSSLGAAAAALDPCSATQPPSLLLARSLAVRGPNLSSNSDSGHAAPPLAGRHPLDPPVAYYQSSDLGTSCHSCSPADASLFSVSGRLFADQHLLAPADGTPVREGAVVDSGAVKPPLSSRGNSEVQVPAEEPARRLELHSPEATRAPRSRSTSDAGNATSGDAAVTPGRLYKAETLAEVADVRGCDVSRGGLTQQPCDDAVSSATRDDAATSLLDEEADYYSYWNELSSNGGSSASLSDGHTNLPGVHPRRQQPHTPEQRRPPGSLRRPGDSAKDGDAPPALSGLEEVAGDGRRPSHRRVLVMRTRREEKQRKAGGKEGGKLPPAHRSWHENNSASAATATIASSSATTSDFGASSATEHPSNTDVSRYRLSKTPLPPRSRSKSHSTPSPTSLPNTEDPKVGNTVKMWFKRRR